jgi:transposase
MLSFDQEAAEIRGTHGALGVQQDDEITRKLMMLIEGECEGLGAQAAAGKHGYSRQRYYQIRNRFREGGAAALQSEKRGPKTRYRRTPEVVRQVVRHRFLDPDASAAVIAQKLQQCGLRISQRSVERVVEEYGLLKKTLPESP